MGNQTEQILKKLKNKYDDNAITDEERPQPDVLELKIDEKEITIGTGSRLSCWEWNMAWGVISALPLLAGIGLIIAGLIRNGQGDSYSASAWLTIIIVCAAGWALFTSTSGSLSE